MEMHQVRYFLAVAEELNFTRAAESCNVSQPSLTRAIKLLEEELGGPLFHRERANTHLSELGRMVHPHFAQVYEQAQTAKREAKDFAKLSKTELKLGVMCTIAPGQLIELLSAVQAKHPGVELKIVDAPAQSLEERLVNGDLEVAIYCRPDVERNEKLHYMPLFKEQFVIVLHPQHELAGRDAVRAADLSGQRYVNRVNCEFAHMVGPIWRQHGFLGLERVYSSERDDWILAMIASGLGFGFMPKACATHPMVVTRPLVDPECWREVDLVTVRGRPHSPAVGALVREAMRTKWFGGEALAVSRERDRALPD
jgi:LysR family transcriptional regulator, hydrogen peroxide-inducible genes activator